ncbi:MAG: TonB-dependent receptor [Nevskiaceae bacterium]|jgi:iron complex outermembrane receptor protein|nr:TonB-dependent receptor [Nevskiaceae bacterium]
MSGSSNVRRAVRHALLATTFAALALPAAVQAADADDELAEVVVTGSAIRRADAETAVPLTVLNVTDLRPEGKTSVEEVLGSLGANQTSTGTSQTVGLGTGGASYADLRGIGTDKTLVLLNGRRIANSSFSSAAPDLNSIPLAAIQNVQVLRDSASSLYGTDAIGGVINFITRNDFQGLSFTGGYDHPEHPGGATISGNIGGGFGSLDTQGFNVFAFVDYQKQDNVSGTQRPFNTRFPGGLSFSPLPANYAQGDGSVFYNAAGPGCTTGLFTIPNDDPAKDPTDTSCLMTTSSFVDYIPESERLSGLIRGDVKVGENNTLSVEYFVARSSVKTLIAPVPYAPYAQNPFLPDGVTPNPYYPNNPALDPTYNGADFFEIADWNDDVGCTFGVDCSLSSLGFTSGNLAETPFQPGMIWVQWRGGPTGPRGDDNISLQHRALLSFQGSAGAWDYQTGVSWNRTTTDSKLIRGYGDGDRIAEGIISGIINPHGEQDAAGAAYLEASLLPGLLQFGRGTMTTADARIGNNALGDWFSAGRQVAFAFGAEYRHENFLNAANTEYAALVVSSTGVDPTSFSAGKRNIWATYAEVNIPLHSTLDLTLAGRYDHYSDFGDTTNPKVSLRWQPLRQLVIRTAASTGFRAPSLYDLYASQAFTNTGSVTDPLTCPGGVGSGTAGPPNFCNIQLTQLLGGNTELKPEKSKSFSVGGVVEPASNLSFSADYWFIQIQDMINSIPVATILDPANQSWSAQYIHRNASNAISDQPSQCNISNSPFCGYIDSRLQNPGGLITDGVDLNFKWAIRTDVGQFRVNYDSTWVRRYDYQDYPEGPWNVNVGAYVGDGPVFRWKHQLTGNWQGEKFSAGATLHHKSGYADDPSGEYPDNHVKSFTTVDVFAGWQSPIEGLGFTFGIKNLMDKDPPLTGQGLVFQSGYDPRYYDPIGRVFYGRVNYNLDF